MAIITEARGCLSALFLLVFFRLVSILMSGIPRDEVGLGHLSFVKQFENEHQTSLHFPRISVGNNIENSSGQPAYCLYITIWRNWSCWPVVEWTAIQVEQNLSTYPSVL